MMMATVATNVKVAHVTDQAPLTFKYLTVQSRRYLKRLDWNQCFIDVYCFDFEGLFVTKKPQEILSHPSHLTWLLSPHNHLYFSFAKIIRHLLFESFSGVGDCSFSALGLSQISKTMTTIIEKKFIKDEKMTLRGCPLIINTSTLIIILLNYWGGRTYTNGNFFKLTLQSALFNFQSFLTLVVLFICTCTYIRQQFPHYINQWYKEGFKGVVRRSAVIGNI